MELAAKLADGLVGVQERLGSVRPQGDDDLRIQGFNLSLEVRQTVDDLIGSRFAVVRRAALEDVPDEHVFAFQPAGFDDLVEELACPADDLTAICFTPSTAFSQTPGPEAGNALRSGS